MKLKWYDDYHDIYYTGAGRQWRGSMEVDMDALGYAYTGPAGNLMYPAVHWNGRKPGPTALAKFLKSKDSEFRLHGFSKVTQ